MEYEELEIRRCNGAVIVAVILIGAEAPPSVVPPTRMAKSRVQKPPHPPLNPPNIGPSQLYGLSAHDSKLIHTRSPTELHYLSAKANT